MVREQSLTKNYGGAVPIFERFLWCVVVVVFYTLNRSTDIYILFVCLFILGMAEIE